MKNLAVIGRARGSTRTPPAAEEASRFRGEAPIGGCVSRQGSLGTTVGNRQSLRVHCCGCGAYGTMRASFPTEIYNSPCRGGQGRPPLRMTWWRAEVDDRKGRPLRIAGTSSGRSRALPVAFFIFLRKRRYGGVGAGMLCTQEKLCNFFADFLFT